MSDLDQSRTPAISRSHRLAHPKCICFTHFFDVEIERLSLRNVKKTYFCSRIQVPDSLKCSLVLDYETWNLAQKFTPKYGSAPLQFRGGCPFSLRFDFLKIRKNIFSGNASGKIRGCPRLCGTPNFQPKILKIPHTKIPKTSRDLIIILPL